MADSVHSRNLQTKLKSKALVIFKDTTDSSCESNFCQSTATNEKEAMETSVTLATATQPLLADEPSPAAAGNGAPDIKAV